MARAMLDDSRRPDSFFEILKSPASLGQEEKSTKAAAGEVFFSAHHYILKKVGRTIRII